MTSEVKTLKFQPHLVEEILSGRKTVTWRFFDDKDLQAGDMVLFYNHQTQEPFALVRLVSSVLKPLGKITIEDMAGHESYSSSEEMLLTHKKLYGDRVTWETEVKMIGFQIVTTTNSIVSTIGKIVSQSLRMAEEVLGVTFPISSVTIFSHNPKEFEDISILLNQLGTPYNYNNGPRVVLNSPIQTENQIITHVRIRHPDSERPQQGCCDFDTDFAQFKDLYLEQFSGHLTLIHRSEYDMIELHGPEYNVLAYVVSQ